MNLRPINNDLINACFNAKTCHTCSMRQACPIRSLFYISDFKFEICLQTTELDASKLLGENEAYRLTQDLRSKRYCELKDYPDKYSFN